MMSEARCCSVRFENRRGSELRAQGGNPNYGKGSESGSFGGTGISTTDLENYKIYTDSHLSRSVCRSLSQQALQRRAILYTKA